MADDRTGMDGSNGRTTTTPNNDKARPLPSSHWKRDKLKGDFQSWWSEARQCEDPPSAFDFLVKMGLEEKLVQKMLWEALAEQCPLNPERSMDYYTVDNSYNNDEDGESWYNRRTLHINPGIIDYYCQSLFRGDDQKYPSMYHAPKSLPIFRNYSGLVEAAFISRGQNPGGVSEQDLLTLIKLAHEAERYEGATYSRYMLDIRHAVVKQCMRYKTYPTKFMRDLIEGFNFWDAFRSEVIMGSLNYFRLPQYDVSNIRNAIDHDCLLGIKDILNQDVEFLELREDFWTERAFREFLHLLPQTRCLGEVTLFVPEQYVEDLTMPDKGAAFAPQMELDCQYGDNGKCGIDKLTLEFRRKRSWEAPDVNALPNVNAFPGGLYAIQSIFSMPDLQELVLELSTWPLANAAPSLIRAIQEKNKLEKVFITVDSHDDTSDALVMAMLGALKNNSSIHRFCYRANNRRSWSLDEAHVGPYETQLLELLQHNTTLYHVELCHTKIEGKVKYLLSLNKHGRRHARDPQTKVADFVAILTTSLEETLPSPEDEAHWERIYSCQRNRICKISRERKRKNDNALGICYGLLRESPDSWCIHALKQPTVSKRRRLS